MDFRRPDMVRRVPAPPARRPDIVRKALPPLPRATPPQKTPGWRVARERAEAAVGRGRD